MGIFDVGTSQFSTVATTGDATTGDYKYRGAGAVGTKVIFGPGNQNNVGIFDVATSQFSSASTAAHAHQPPDDGAWGRSTWAHLWARTSHSRSEPSSEPEKSWRRCGHSARQWSRSVCPSYARTRECVFAGKKLGTPDWCSAWCVGYRAPAADEVRAQVPASRVRS